MILLGYLFQVKSKFACHSPMWFQMTTLNHLLFENHTGKPDFVLNYVCSNMWYCYPCQVLLAFRVNYSCAVKIQQLAAEGVLE